MSTAPLLLSPELLAQLERLELVSRKIFRGRMKGERRSRRKGQSVEFADFRNYVPGDDLRFIDWNTYARLDRLFLKLFLEEEDLHFYAADRRQPVDGFRRRRRKFHYAKQLAAALGFIGLVRGDRVKIETLGRAAGLAARSCAAGAACGGCSITCEGLAARRNGLAGRRAQELLPAQLGQGHRRADERPDGQGRLRARPCAICSPRRWTST